MSDEKRLAEEKLTDALEMLDNPSKIKKLIKNLKEDGTDINKCHDMGHDVLECLLSGVKDQFSTMKKKNKEAVIGIIGHLFKAGFKMTKKSKEKAKEMLERIKKADETYEIDDFVELISDFLREMEKVEGEEEKIKNIVAEYKKKMCGTPESNFGKKSFKKRLNEIDGKRKESHIDELKKMKKRFSRVSKNKRVLESEPKFQFGKSRKSRKSSRKSRKSMKKSRKSMKKSRR